MSSPQTNVSGSHPRTYALKLANMAHRGKTVARHDGKVVFVPFGIPGEQVEVRIFRAKRKYSEGEITQILEPSPDRVEPACPHYGTCGGCQLQHVAYDRQLEMKRQVVQDLLARIGGFSNVQVLPTVPSPKQYGYRNSARFLSGARGDLGFTDWKSNSFIPIDTCPIMAPPINETLRKIQGQGVPREPVRVRCSEATGETAIWASPQSPEPTGRTDTTHKLLGSEFFVSATSFFQVNTRQAETLISLAIERLRPLTGQLVVDAYCGVGTFSRFLAEESEAVIGIESSPSAISDAGRNLSSLGVKLIRGLTEIELPKLKMPVNRVLLDPPRTGCESPTIEALLRLAPEKIVYVSCEPATLARDLKMLCSNGAYQLIDVQPVDMFPQTYHIECVATLYAL